MAILWNHFVGDQDRDFCQKVEMINFDSVARLLKLKYQWKDLKIEQEIDRYKQLLFLINRYPDQPFIPDQETDLVIHAHLATGDQYIKDCQTLFRAYLEHEKGFGVRREADRRVWIESFKRGQLLIAQWFNRTPTDSRRPACCVLRLTATSSLSFNR